MLDKLLLKMVQRGAQVTGDAEGAVQGAPAEAQSRESSIWSSSLSSGSASSSFSPQVSDTSCWDAATGEYLIASKSRTNITELSPRFINWQLAHLAIAELVHYKRKTFPAGHTIHITHLGGDLLAIVDGTAKTIWLRKSVTALAANNLRWNALPASARAHTGMTADFEEVGLIDVMWFYGQALPRVVTELDPEVAFLPLQLRQFPALGPDMVLLRHIDLLRILMRGRQTFKQLHEALTGHSQLCLCADIATLIVCGSVKPVQPRK